MLYRLVPALNVLVPAEQSEHLDLNLFACKSDREQQLADAGLLLPPGALVTDYTPCDLKTIGFWDLPYAREMRERWETEVVDTPPRRQLAEAVASFYESRPLSRKLAHRYAALIYSFRLFSILCQDEKSETGCLLAVCSTGTAQANTAVSRSQPHQ